MTSANVIEYTITKDGKRVGHFRKNVMCSLPEYSELLKYTPLDEHQICAYGYDEEDEFWEDEPVNLKEYLIKIAPFEKKLREHFKSK